MLFFSSRITVLELPAFDTGQYNCEFFEFKGGNASLKIDVEGSSPIILRFNKTRWHQHFSLYTTPSKWADSYFKVMEIVKSQALAKFVKNDPSPVYKELHHYRLMTEEGGYELFAETVALNSEM